MERGTAGSPRRCQSLKAAVGLLWDEVEGLGVCRRVAVGGCEGDAAGWSADDLSSLLDALICALHDLLVLSEKRWLPGAGESWRSGGPEQLLQGPPAVRKIDLRSMHQNRVRKNPSEPRRFLDLHGKTWRAMKKQPL
ncbi:hypothetical protein DIPPA_19723 [Diplonema papillatum]|nr:hypothetical protein DIPPA_19723 [Diplonema papillatum]